MPEEPVGLLEGLLTTRAIRRYRPDPVPAEHLATILHAATRAPSGSNRQPFRFLVLGPTGTGLAARRLIADAARSTWAAKARADGYQAGSGTDPGSAKSRLARTMRTYVERLDAAPVLLLACLVRYREPNSLEGGSVYPACQNLLLAARALGYGGVMTSFHAPVEGQLRELLAIPPQVAIAATITLGRPQGRHGPVRRRPLRELVYQDGWQRPAPWALDPPGTRHTQAGPPPAPGAGDTARVTVQERTTSGHEGELYTVTWEHPDPKRVVVLCHGYGEHIRRYDHVAQALVAAGAAVYGQDHLGHGRSAGERASVRDFAAVVADLHQLVRTAAQEHPGLPVVLVGHSMGGLVATLYAQAHPEQLRGLVLSGPAVGDSGAALIVDLPELPEIPIDVATLSRDPDVGAAYAADPLVYHGGFKRETLRAFAAGHEAVVNGPGFGELPVLWLHGGEDQLVPIEATRPVVEQLAGADFTERVYPGARHEIFNETNRDEVLADLVAFVERVSAPAS